MRVSPCESLLQAPPAPLAVGLFPRWFQPVIRSRDLPARRRRPSHQADGRGTRRGRRSRCGGHSRSRRFHQPDVIIHQMTDLGAARDLRHFDRAFATSNASDAWNRHSAGGRPRGRRQTLHRPELSAAGPSRAPAVRSKPKPMSSIRIRRRNFAARWKRSSIWSGPSPARRSPKASCCAMDRSTARHRHVRRRDGGAAAPSPRAADRRWRRMVVVPACRRCRFGRRRSRSSAASPAASTISSMMIPRRSGNGCRRWPMLGAKPPFHLPAWIARLLAGEHIVAMMTQGARRIECQGQAGAGLAAGPSVLASGLCGIAGACSSRVRGVRRPESLELRPAAAAARP